MFNEKKKSLFDSSKKTASVPASTMVSNNPFVNYGKQKNSQTLSSNGSHKLGTSGSNFVDQFASASRYKEPRPFSEVISDMEKLWAQNSLLALCFLFYLRMITRIVSFFTGEKTSVLQRGQGLRHEGIFRMMWVAIYHPDTFWKNITLFISVGSWKDIITMLQYDLVYNGWEDRKLDWNKFLALLLAGLENPNTTELIKKYLPQIKANSACHTVEAQADNIIAKWLCSNIFGKNDANHGTNYKKYRQLKASGKAHTWQQLISKHKMLDINFDTIHGRALSQLVSSKFLKNQGLESKYEAWINSKPVAKFTGYVYELIQGKSYGALTSYQRTTINAQFNQLVETARKGLSEQGLRPISVLDCSGSMSSPMYLGGGKVGTLRSIEVAFSNAIFFNEMMLPKSPFYNTFLEFSNRTEMHHFTGNNFIEKYFNSRKAGYGGTNFESIFTFFADFKHNNPTVDESLIPNFIVCWSDGEFDSVGSQVSNVTRGRQILKRAGYSQEYCDSFGMCFVDLPNTFYGGQPKVKFETFANEKNVFYFSGYDLSPLAFLFGVEGKTLDSIPKNADELFLAAMDQEVLKKLEI